MAGALVVIPLAAIPIVIIVGILLQLPMRRMQFGLHFRF